MRNGPEHALGLSSTALALGGKWVQYTQIDLTGNETMDYLLQNNFDSILGMVSYAYIFDLIAGKKVPYSHLGLFTAAWVLFREGTVDPMLYRSGIDFTDLIGGVLASSLYFLIAANRTPKQ